MSQFVNLLQHNDGEKYKKAHSTGFPLWGTRTEIYEQTGLIVPITA